MKVTVRVLLSLLLFGALLLAGCDSLEPIVSTLSKQAETIIKQIQTQIPAIPSTIPELQRMGNPVLGGEIYIELEEDDPTSPYRYSSNIGPISLGSKSGNNPLKTAPGPGKQTVRAQCVNGAGVTISLMEFNTPVGQCVTNKNGEFSFDVIFPGTNIPEKLKLNFSITPSSALALVEEATNQITVEVKTSDGPHYTFGLWWLTSQLNMAAENKGTFAVSGKSTA